jgi:sugar lactone lactonase YvrE
VARSGNVYVATHRFVDILDVDGLLLGKIQMPKPVANLEFAGPHGLWIVGEGGIFRVKFAEFE